MSRGTRGRIRDVMSRGRRPLGRDGHRGQSLVEFALILPVLLLLALIAIDFGRIYLGWINLQNMTRIAANYAANNYSSFDSADYAAQIAGDAQATNCPLAPGQPAPPQYTDTDLDGKILIGDRASVTLTCRFHVITPLISFIVGSDVSITTTTAFPIKQSLAATSSGGGGGGGGGGCTLPSPSIRATPSTSGTKPLTVNFLDASGGGAGTSWTWDFGDPAISDSSARDPGNVVFNNPGTWTVTLTVGNACGFATTSPGTTITVGSTPVLCVVPNFTAQGGKRISSEAPGLWSGAGFTTTIQVGTPGNGSDWKIKSQSIVANTSVACDSTITVSG